MILHHKENNMKLSTTLNIYSLLGNTNTPDRMIEAVKVCAACGYEAVDLYLKRVIDLSEHELDKWITRMQSTIADCGIQIIQCLEGVALNFLFHYFFII